MRRWLLVLLIAVILPPAGVLAEDAEPEVQAADAVLEAVKTKDDAALKVLAGRDEPDPWLVADLLLARGALEAARRFAEAAARPATEALVRYVSGARDESDAKRRAALERMNAALGSGDWQSALAEGEACSDPKSGVSGVRLRFGRGLALRELGRAREAIPAFLAAGEAAEHIGWRSRAALAFHRAGRQAHATGDVEETLRLWQHAHRLAQAIGDRDLTAMTMTNIGVALLDLGRYGEARTVIEDALTIRRGLGDPSALANSLINAGVVYQRVGEYAAALTSIEEARAVAAKAQDLELLVSALQGLAAMKSRLRDPEGALHHSQAALAISIEQRWKDEIAAALDGAGGALVDLGRFEEAAQHYERALVIVREQGGGRREGTLLVGLSDVFKRMDKPREAAAYLAEALPIQVRAGDREGAAGTLLKLAVQHASAKDYPVASAHLERAQSILDEMPHASLQMRVHWASAGIHYGLREWPACIDRCRQAEAIASGLGVRLGEMDAASVSESVVGIFDTALRAAVRLPEPARSETLWHFLESGRALTLRVALGARDALHATLVPPALDREYRRARKEQATALKALRRAHAEHKLAEARAARTRLEAIQARQELLFGRLRRAEQAGVSIAYPKPEPLDRVQARLAAEEALVLYGLTERDAVALVVTRAAVRSVPLARSRIIRTICDAFLGDPEHVVRPATATPLTKLLVDPLGLEPTIRRVIVSPSQVLAYVPFALLFPEHEIVYVPSGTTYGLLHANRQLRGTGILALGDPAYGGASPRQSTLRGALGRRLVRLPATRGEVNAVGDVKLLGARATPTALRSALKTREHWRAVHLACHGLVDAERPLLSALALSPDKTDDGLLQCMDIFRLRIPADLVTLSACETAKGRMYRTEGILGLTRAFMFAGAPRVLCSLWKVDDEATKVLMIKFYELWNPQAKPGDPELVEGAGRNKGLGAAAALKQAQAYVRDHPDHPEWKHPYYWAAWVLWGLPT